MAIMDSLKDSALFGSLSTGQLEKVSLLCRGGSYQKGTVMFKEGDEATELWILTDGRVALEMEVCPVPGRPPIPTALEVVTKGECMGWSALVEPHFLTVSGRCLTNCTVLAIKGDMLRKAMDDDPALGYEVMKKAAQIMRRRLTDTRLRLTSGLGLVLLGKELGASG